MAKKKQTKKEKTLEENLRDEVYVNYNILLKLDEIKRINFAIFEILNAFYLKVLEEETPKKKKIQKEGTFKNN